jgi:replication initiation and membrane attachment protein DnaB
VTIGGITFENFEQFAEYVLQQQVSKEEAIMRVKRGLAEFEQKYGMTSEEFYRTIAGTVAEDEIDFWEWRMEYESYLELVEED